jgi:two-component system sensor histidine kinase CreC
VKIGLRIFLGYFLVVGLAGYFVMRVFVDEVKPGVRQAMEDTLVDTANALAEQAAPDLREGNIAHGRFAAGIAALGRRDVDARSGTSDKKPRRLPHLRDRRARHRRLRFRRARRRQGLFALERRLPHAARALRRALHAQRPEGRRSSVMHVAAPIRERSTAPSSACSPWPSPNARMQPFIDNSRASILRKGGLLLGLSFLVGVLVPPGCRARWPRWAATPGRDLGRARAAAGLGRQRDRRARARAGDHAREAGRQAVRRAVRADPRARDEGPLAAIRAASEILHDEPPAPERARFLGNIDSQAARLSTMIDACCRWRRWSTASRWIDGSRWSCRSWPRAWAPAWRRGWSGTGSAWTARSSRALRCPAMPSCSSRPCPTCSTTRSNSRRADRTLELRLARAGGRLRLSVADRGPGVPEFALPRVFERFYSLPRPDGARSSGIGLNFVREVAALHGGEAWLRNRDGGGAEAGLDLPLG